MNPVRSALAALVIALAPAVPAQGAAPVTAPVAPINASEAIAASWDFQDPLATEKKFRRLLNDPRAQEPGFKAEVETQIARTFSLRAMFDQAHQILDGVEKDLKGKDLPRARTRYLLERGRCFNSANRQKDALPLFMEAWDVARKAKEDSLAVDAAHMVAIAEADPKLQEKWNQEAIAYAEASADPAAKQWLGSLLNNLGWTFHDAGRPAEALALFEKCLAWHRAHKPDGEGVMIARWTVARCLRTLGRHEQASSQQQALAADRALKGLPEDGYVSEELAENLLAMGKKAEARPHFARAHALLKDDPFLQQNEAKRLQRLQDLGSGKE